MLGRPIIQYPQDMVAIQELIWKIKTDLVIETGIAHGGSLILSASMLALLDYCEAVETDQTLDPKTSFRRVLGIDIDIRPHNRAAIEAHPMAHRIDMIQGSSIAQEIVTQVHQAAAGHERIMVMLDSNHTHEHVLARTRCIRPIGQPRQLLRGFRYRDRGSTCRRVCSRPPLGRRQQSEDGGTRVPGPQQRFRGGQGQWTPSS